MLDQATSVFVTGGATIQPVLGDLPPEDERRSLADMLQERPAARRHGGGMAISVPLPRGKWCVWLLSDVPGLTALAPLLAKIQALCTTLVGIGQANVTAGGDFVPLLGARLAGPCRRTRDFVTVLSTALVEAGEAAGLAVFVLRNGRVQRIWGGDSRVAQSTDLLSNLIGARLQAGEPSGRMVRGDAQPGTGVEVGLILDRLGADFLHLLLPARGEGYGAIVIDAADPPGRGALEVPALMQIARPLRVGVPQAHPLRRYALWALAVAGTLFLLWPVPAKITVSGVAVPAHSVVAALPADATLQAMLVRVGDNVTKGQPVAHFASQQLSEQLSQEQLNIVVEELNVQAAMAKNDYGAAQLAGQRREIARTRHRQIEERIARLDVVAPADGRVISALGQNATGAGFPAGHEVVAVQTDTAFLMALTPSRVDARRIGTDMTGTARFRGLSGEDFDVQVLTPPALVRDAASASERMEVTARLNGKGSNRLMAGLTGYARLEGKTSPRILGLSHYLIEYLRTWTWTWLGLRF